MDVTEQYWNNYKMVQHQLDIEDAQCIYCDLAQEYPEVSFSKKALQEIYEKAVALFRKNHDWSISDYDQLRECIIIEIDETMKNIQEGLKG